MSRRFAERLTITIIFSVVQIWALIVLLVQFRAHGVLAAAAALVMSAAVIAVHDAWRDLRADRSAEQPAEQPEVASETTRDSDLVQL